MSENTIFESLPPAGATELTGWQVWRASGADAVSFLHGQLTHDLALLKADAARLNAYCNPQGRMLANLLTWRDGPEDVMLALPRALAEPTLKRLRMFVMRANCQFAEDSAQRLWGVWGDAVPPQLTQAWQVWRNGDATWVRLNDGHQAGARALLWGPSVPTGVELQTEAVWDALSIGAAEAWLTPETSSAFVPQMLNWESLDGISFKKGCYPGQEVVARSQFRGAIKRRTERVSSATPLQAGQSVWTAAQEVGSVVNAASVGETHLALVCVHVGEAQDQPLFASAADGVALARLGLPYALREDI